MAERRAGAKVGADALAAGSLASAGWRMLIDGHWVESASGERFETLNPSLDEALAEVPAAGAEDVEQAVAAARRAFAPWAALDVDKRARALGELAAAIDAQAPLLGMLDALDSGNPLTAMIGDARKGASRLRYFANLGSEIKGETIPTPGGGLDYTRRQPFGVVARILPFNHPISFAAGKIAAPLIAGNTVVLKPAEQTPLSALVLASLAREHLPPGVLNVLSGDGPNCGAALVRHREVRRIAFTGGVETGRAITREAGIKTLSLELGGKNPLIVYPDVDVASAADAAVAGMNYVGSQGQSCGSNSRVFVHESVHDAFLAEVTRRAAAIVPGLAHLEATRMGPLITRRHYERVREYVRLGVEEGGEVVAGGGHPGAPELQRGYFFEPTVIAGVRHGMRIEQEEIFGPVMAVLRWTDPERMLEEVNDVDYGLCANIWTNDISRALSAADRIEAGYVWINGHGGKRFGGAPFGGFKDSGLGRENSLDELLSYTQVKNVNVAY